METKLKTFSEIREMKFKNADERMDYMVTEICNYRFMLQKMIINGINLVMVGADYTSNGMRTYLKPLDEVLKNQDDLCWLGSSEGAIYYVDNKNRKLFDAYNK
nr:MAG: hypothetical protein [Bacteriophage sp.]